MPKGPKKTANQKLAEIRAEIADKMNLLRTLEPEAKSEDRKREQRRAFLVGESWLMVTLTDQEKRVRSNVLQRREPKPKDWHKIEDLILAEPVPVNESEAVDFVPAGSKLLRPNRAAEEAEET